MNFGSTDTCAGCKEFPINKVQENPEIVCKWRPGSRYFWDSGACVLFVYDTERREHRRNIVRIMREKTKCQK